METGKEVALVTRKSVKGKKDTPSAVVLQDPATGHNILYRLEVMSMDEIENFLKENSKPHVTTPQIPATE